jgi:chromate transporter
LLRVDLLNRPKEQLADEADAVVAQVIWSMARSLCPDRLRRSLALGAAPCLLIWPSAIGQLAVILFAGVIGCPQLR